MTLDDIKDTGLSLPKSLSKESIMEALGINAKPEPSEYVLPVMGIFAAGLLSGLAAGFLLAPQSGKKTRDQVDGAVENARGKAMDKARDVSDAIAN